MKLPVEVKRLLSMWANTENAETRKDSGWHRVAAGFQDYRPDTAYRETMNKIEWTTEECREIDKIGFAMSVIATYDPLGFQVVRKYWKGNQSINCVLQSGLGIGRKKIEKKLNQAHKAILRELGVETN